jgi:hypothetical protein
MCKESPLTTKIRCFELHPLASSEHCKKISLALIAAKMNQSEQVIVVRQQKQNVQQQGFPRGHPP